MDAQQELGLSDNQTLWSAKEIAAYIGYSERHVRERVVHEHGFPKPARNIRGRWLKSEIIRHYTRR